MLLTKRLSLISGMICGLAFAPIFFVPGLLTIALLCYQIQNSNSLKQAALFGFIFGFGYFLISMYWISIGITIYIDEFWWAIPFALFGLPLILACFISSACGLSWYARKKEDYYQIIFCTSWVFFEWVRSWIFTGLPWNLVAYSLAFSDILVQSASLISVYGLGFIAIYISTSFYYILNKQTKQLRISLLTSFVLFVVAISYGVLRLEQNPTDFSDIKVRLIQPSIPQTAKWDPAEFRQNLDSHINLSLSKLVDNPDLIIWSEAALVAPYKNAAIKDRLSDMLKLTDSILISGGVTDNGQYNDNYKIYTTMFAIDQIGDTLFEYHKSHLVPFGEYMPLKNLLPIKKLTHGLLDYTEGNGKLVYLNKLDLWIKALICYESIFPNEVRVSNKMADIIINVTNDSWYGKSSGPYQHFHISRIRAVENGLPMLRVANNGISAIIDPLGRIIKKLELNDVNILDGTIPNKLRCPTLYSRFGDINMLIALLLVLLIQPLMKNLSQKFA